MEYAVSRIKILMVEDSPLDADLIQSRLTAGEVDAEYVRVETREDFVRALEAGGQDLILADYSLPSFDGLSALAIARERCPGVPFIFVSGVLGEEVAVDTLQKGATDYVLKQRLNRLVPAVTRALAEAREREARHQAEEGLRIASETARLVFWQEEIGADGGSETPGGGCGDAEVHPEDRERVRRAYERAAAGRTDYDAEYRVVRGDGSVRWVVARGRAVYAANGMPLRMVGVSIDITDRKRAEEELKVARDAAEAANRAKDHFLAVLSHELRTPLSPIITTLHLMELEGELPPAMAEHVEVIRRNVELEARLIDDLLDLTRIARGKLQLHTQPVDVHATVRATLDICSSDVRGKRQELSLDLAARRSTVEGDSARLQQVLWNLIKNATKFTPIGGRIGVRTRDVGGSLAVEVSDTGIGVEESALCRIFNAFEQADGRVTRQYGGLGLGLAIAKAIVEMHGGTLTCRSGGAGRGATFTVTLPTVAYAAAPRRLAPVDGEARPLRILLVEDHADTARAMSSLLRLRGHEVRHAAGVSAAMGIARAEKFDLLISDIGLPDGSGIDVVRQTAMRGVPSIALTGYGSDEDVARCRAAGFDHHLTKPVNFEKLEAAIRHLVGSEVSG